MTQQVVVLRVTRHSLTEAQEEALRRAVQQVLGLSDEVSLTVVQHSETVAGGAQVADLIAQHGAQVVEVVLPINILAELLGELKKRGLNNVPVLRAVMDRRVVGGEVVFEFRGYEQIIEISVRTQPLNTVA